MEEAAVKTVHTAVAAACAAPSATAESLIASQYELHLRVAPTVEISRVPVTQPVTALELAMLGDPDASSLRNGSSSHRYHQCFMTIALPAPTATLSASSSPKLHKNGHRSQPESSDSRDFAERDAAAFSRATAVSHSWTTSGNRHATC